ncbi:tetratricopeptide repeat protein [Melioribacteraceae bacterium 4301-Me]|uniref:tetratricopeptide repeat protein n=1 Tax=Pyranulibacter aquaticus TaxID=3163344 RepID=UPI0035953E5A
MNQLSEDLSIDKIKLIYEFDKNSPLFARVAYYEIANGNYISALEILENGLEIYPDYPTAYFLHGLAFAYAGNLENARISINRGAALLNNPASLEFYHQKIEEIIRERNLISDAKRPVLSNVSENLNTTDNDISAKNELEDYLDKLAEKISNAKIKYNNEDIDENKIKMPEYTGEKIVSETLAEIYYSQGKYNEALQTYEALLKIRPAMSDYYQKKINNIKSLLKQQNDKN